MTQIRGKIKKIFRGNEMELCSNVFFSLEDENKKLIKCSGFATIYLGEHCIIEGEMNAKEIFQFSSFMPDFENISSKEDILKKIFGKEANYNYIKSIIVEKSGKKFANELEQSIYAIRTIVKAFTDGNKKLFTSTGKIKTTLVDKYFTKWNKNFGFYTFYERMCSLKIQLDTKACYSIYANKAFQSNVDNNFARLEANPFELLCLSKVKFEAIDMSFCKNNGNPNDPRRIYGAILSVIQDDFEAGNNYNTYDFFVEKAMAKLKSPLYPSIEISKEDVANGFRKLHQNQIISVDKNKNIYLYENFKKEEFIRSYVLKNKNITYPGHNYDKIIMDYEEEKHMKFGRDQKRGIVNCLNNKLSILTGGAGTGKTSTLSAILYFLIHNFGIEPKRIALAAPTGKAAQRMTATIRKNLGTDEMIASTIHVLLKPRLEYIGDEDNFYYNENNKLENYDLFVVDETSMLDHNIAYHYLAAIPSHARVIFMGDTEQLPPVKNGYFLRDLMESGVAQVDLKETFRQKGDSTILEIATGVRNCKLTTGVFDKKSDYLFVEFPKTMTFQQKVSKIVDFYCASVKKTSTEEKPMNLDDTMILCPTKSLSKTRDTFNTKIINAEVQKRLLPDKEGEYKFQKNDEWFKVGSKVIITKNNYAINCINGDIGYIKEINQEEKQVTIQIDDGRVVTLEADDLNHLQLAYAITVHKSQGSEWKNVIYCCFNDTQMNRKNLVYTAVTRPKKNLVIVGNKETLLNSPNNLEPHKNSKILN